MATTIAVGDLRRISTAMLTDVQKGQEYLVTNHGREVERVVPLTEDQR